MIADLRHYFSLRAASLQALAATERERRALERGESTDVLRLDARWFDAFRDPSELLLDVLGEASWVVYPAQVRHVRAATHHVPWHQDVAYQRLLGARGHARHRTCFVPMDAEPAGRPTIEFARGDVPELPHTAASGFGAGLLAEPEGERVTFRLAPGDALLFGDLVPHRTVTLDPAQPERLSLEFRLVHPADALANKDYFDVRAGCFTRGGARVGVA